MRKLMLASTVLLLVVGQAMAQESTQVSMELEVGGSNNGATCTNRVFFTPGTNLNYGEGSPPQGPIPLDPNGHVTWAVRVHASGSHLKDSDGNGTPDDPPVYIPARGVANYVFDLELYRDSIAPANLVTEAVFTSTANIVGSCGNESDPTKNKTLQFLSNAAFPYTFNISGYGPARIFDPYKAGSLLVGGPRMEVHCYPKAPPFTGQLFGMGAGYAKWYRSTLANADNTYGGIGKGDYPTPNDYPNPMPACTDGDPTSAVGCQGWGPVAEGQIEGLAAGTYVLRLIPGGGINVLRGEVSTTSRAVIAKAATYASGSEYEDTITFVVESPPEPVTTVTAWKSVKTHSTSAPQDFAITLNFATGTNATTESRSGRTGDPLGIEQIVMTTDGAAAPVLASPLPATWGGLTVTGASVNGADVIVTLSGCVDRTCYAFEASEIITNLTDPDADSADCKVVAMIGDANNGRSVTTTDYTAIKNVLNQPVTDANCRCDINCGKSITTTDYTAVKNKLVSGSVTCVN